MDKKRLRRCCILRQVNKAFYYSATRLMFQAFVIPLDREAQGGDFPFLKFEELCRNANARYVERLVIKSCESTTGPAAYNPGDFAGSCKKVRASSQAIPIFTPRCTSFLQISLWEKRHECWWPHRADNRGSSTCAATQARETEDLL
jgi:hypothetical protein